VGHVSISSFGLALTSRRERNAKFCEHRAGRRTFFAAGANHILYPQPVIIFDQAFAIERQSTHDSGHEHPGGQESKQWQPKYRT
jgi:hypothetical protein